MSTRHKFSALLWKMFICRKKHFAITTIEIFLPILTFLLMAYARSHVSSLKKEVIPERINEPFDLDSIYETLTSDNFNLWYTPQNNCTDNIIQIIEDTLALPSNAVRYFSSESKLLESNPRNNTFIAGVIFRYCDHMNLDYDLKIYKEHYYWDTTKLFADDESSSSNSEGAYKYISDGVAALQMTINLAFMNLTRESSSFNINFSLQQFPILEHVVDNGINAIYLNCLPLITVFSFIFQCPSLVKRMVEEKSSGVKEYMKIVGMRNSILWFGWVFYSLICNILSVLVITIIMKISWNVPYPLIEHTDPTLMFSFLLLYCMVSVTISLLISSLSNNSSNAMAIGILFWTFSYFVPKFINDTFGNLSLFQKFIMALYPNMALQYGYTAILNFESRDIGANWTNFFQSAKNSSSDLALGHIFLIYFLEFIGFSLLSIYIENVNPGTYGIPKSYFYPISIITKLFKRNGARQSQLNFESDYENAKLIQDFDENEICIEINNLCKTYGAENAVNNLNWSIPKNTITVLLGKNGAGKTSTISMISGMIAASSGDIHINGKNIRTDLDLIRNKMGLCTQHNLLFADLTVKQHLIFFSMVKGNSLTKASEDAEKILVEINLKKKENASASTLSGGMQRKLCLGIALLNNPEVLILDEPTSGMDPKTRVDSMNLLMSHREGKTIIITTHFLCDAEDVGDRIAIMNHGKLTCYGSQTFLKEKYNTGYNLILTFENIANSAKIESIRNNILQPCLEQNYIKILERSNNLVKFLLPETSKKYFAKLFKKLEDNHLIKDIDLYSTTLHDIFEQACNHVPIATNDKKNEQNMDSKLESKTHAGPLKFVWIFCSLFRKRCHFFLNTFSLYIPAIVAMLGCFLVPLFFKQTMNFYQNHYNRLELTLDAYGKTDVYYKISENYENIFQSIFDQQTKIASENLIDTIRSIANDNVFYYENTIIAEEIIEADPVEITAMYTNYAIHSIPIAVNLASNLLLKSKLGESAQINASIGPLNLVMANHSPTELSELQVATLWLIFIPIGVILFSSSFIIFPFFEISTQFTMLQFLNGIPKWLYWITNYIFDFIVSAIVIVILSLCLLPGLTMWTWDEYCAIISIFLTYMCCVLPIIYFFSTFKSLSLGLSRFITSGMLIGIILTIFTILLKMSQTEEYFTNSTIQENLKNFFFVFPTFSLHYMSIKFARKYVEKYNWHIMDPVKKNTLCKNKENPCCISGPECDTHKSYFFSENFGILHDIIISIIAVVLFVIILYISLIVFKKAKKTRNCICPKSENNEELNAVSVQNPTNIKKNIIDGIKLEIQKLHSCYNKKPRINDLNFYGKSAQCIGFLGSNGAGKSTTIKILVNEEEQHKGVVKIIKDNKKDITNSSSDYQPYVGYCPQADCLNFQLTGYEIIYHLALVKGYNSKDAKEVTNNFIKTFDFEEHRNKPCYTYSGGTKRKLSTCLAFLANPKIILLDEPTSGVDPIARNIFGRKLQQIKEQFKSLIILSSHSMQETEMLCDRVVVMNEGKIVRQGKLSDMKNNQRKFKIQFTKVKNIEKINEMLSSRFNIGTPYHDYEDRVCYTVSNKLSEIFQVLREKHQLIHSEDYIVSSTSLKDIFYEIIDQTRKSSTLENSST